MSSAEHLRLHLLRQLQLGELAGVALSAAEAHLAGCDACRARMSELEAEQQAFLARSNVGAESAAILARLEKRASEPRGFFAGVNLWKPLAVGLALLLLVIIGLPFRGPDGGSGSGSLGGGHIGTTRIKGEKITLETFVNTPDGPKHLEPGATLTSGDQIQFRYKAGGHRQLLVISIDARAISPLYPAEPGHSIEVEPEGLHVLEGSIILDDVVGAERIVALFSDQPLSFERVKKAAEESLQAHGGKIESLEKIEGLDAEIEQRLVLLHKD